MPHINTYLHGIAYSSAFYCHIFVNTRPNFVDDCLSYEPAFSQKKEKYKYIYIYKKLQRTNQLFLIYRLVSQRDVLFRCEGGWPVVTTQRHVTDSAVNITRINSDLPHKLHKECQITNGKVFLMNWEECGLVEYWCNASRFN